MALFPPRRLANTTARPLHVALVHPYHWDEVRRGGERYLADLAWYLANQGHKVEALVSAHSPRPGPTTNDGIVVRTVPRVRRGVGRIGATEVETHGAVVAADLLRRRYDLVHAFTPSSALAGTATRHPTIYTELGHPDPTDAATKPWLAALHRRAVRAATAVTALSSSAAGALRAVSGREAEVLPAGVRLDLFAPNRLPRRGDPVVLFMADASVQRKGLDVLLAAIALLLPRHPRLRLKLGGPGSAEWAFQKLSEEGEAVRPHVEYLGVGSRAALPERYREATVTALPAVNEALGLVLVESLACGTPIVCTQHGGMAEVVRDAAVGRTFPPGDVAGLASALETTIALAGDAATPARCADRAKLWSWVDTVGPAHEDLYRRTQARGRR